MASQLQRNTWNLSTKPGIVPAKMAGIILRFWPLDETRARRKTPRGPTLPLAQVSRGRDDRCADISARATLLTVLKHSIIALGNGKREGLVMQGAGEWLESLGLTEYTLRFAENYIDSSVLCDLTDQDLEKIGIPLGHRKKMLRAIAELRGIAPAEPPAVAQPLAEDTAERRQVTVMFCDLVGSTALSARLDPEDVREIISAYQKCVAEAVRRFDGFVAKYMGDGVLVYFG